MFKVTKRLMKRKMLAVSLCDHINNQIRYQMSGVKHVDLPTGDVNPLGRTRRGV